MALPPLVDSGIRPEDMVADQTSVDVSVPQPETFDGGAEVIPDGQGGAVVQALAEALMGAQQEQQVPHNANLAELLDDGYLGEISSDLRGSYEEDLESRSEWEDTYTKGLDQLGVKHEERSQPFEGASGVTHPLIAESVTQFQAQAYKELLPSGGPVKTQVLGLQDADREEQASRVKNFMNYQIMRSWKSLIQTWISCYFIYRCLVLHLRKYILTKRNKGLYLNSFRRRIWLYLMLHRIWRLLLVLRMFFAWMRMMFARCKSQGSTKT